MINESMDYASRRKVYNLADKQCEWNTYTAFCKRIREATKKKKKTSQQVWTMGGGGQQILVCEPQKSAFFRANFPKKTCCN